MEYLEKMLMDKWGAVKEKALKGHDVDGVTVLTDFERGKIAAGRFTADHYAARILKRLEKGYTWPEMEKYKRVMTLPSKTVNCITIGIDWSKNIYGMQAAATVTIIYSDGRQEYLQGGRTGGCGYDKSSSTVAWALDTSDYMVKALYEYVNHQMTLQADKRHFSSGMSVFEYNGGDLKYMPRFEGGVGMGPMVRTIELITGLNHNTFHETKKSDFYIITK